MADELQDRPGHDDAADDAVDRRLRDYADGWRARLPEGPGLDAGGFDHQRRRRRLVPVVAAAAVVALVLGITIADLPRVQTAVPPSRHPAASGVVAWKPLPATHPMLPVRKIPARPSPSYAAGVRACRDGDVAAGRLQTQGAAAGTSYDRVVLRLSGSSPCRLNGYPALRASFHGQPVNLRIWHETAVTTWRSPVLLTKNLHGAVVIAIPDVAWCQRVDRLELVLPGLTRAFSFRKTLNPIECLPSWHDQLGVTRVVPETVTPEQVISPYDGIRVGGNLDLTVKPGAKALFEVTLTSPKDLVLVPCPDYTILTGTGEQRWALNCAAVPHKDAHARPYLPAGVPVRFAMQADTGGRSTQKFVWSLDTPEPNGSTSVAGVLTVGSNRPSGTVTGTVTMTGGPAGTPDTKVTSGTVRAIRDDGLTRTAIISADSAYTLTLPPGDYRIQASTPQWNGGTGFGCNHAGTVQVRSGRGVAAAVTCPRK